MTRALLVLALLAGCKHPTPRDEDCATVRDLLDRQTVPRRTYDYNQPRTSDIAISDMDALRALQAHTYRDPEIAAAVKAVGDTGWTIYTPYSTDHESAIDKLGALCGLPRRRIVGQ